jgi:surfeit locus 1 family protein
MQFKLFKYEFRFGWISTVVTLFCIALFIKLGLWQYHKAEYKRNIEQQYQSSLQKKVVSLEDYLDHPEGLQYQKVQVLGEYEPEYQILIDNQVEADQAGFHVLTPLRIKDKNVYVLVNRGWVAGSANHQDVPVFDTPSGVQVISGMLWLPSDKIFTLESPEDVSKHAGKKWSLVWQHLDMKKYQSLAPIKTLDVIIKLDPEQSQGGFVRNWQLPPSRIMTNLSYAYQWFGFAFAAFAIYLYTSITKIKKEE